jgi:hypothetical protein
LESALPTSCGEQGTFTLDVSVSRARFVIN